VMSCSSIPHRGEPLKGRDREEAAVILLYGLAAFGQVKLRRIADVLNEAAIPQEVSGRPAKS
jgi:hypothetical protein